MNMHKRLRLTPLDREEIWSLWQTRQWKKWTLPFFVVFEGWRRFSMMETIKPISS